MHTKQYNEFQYQSNSKLFKGGGGIKNTLYLFIYFFSQPALTFPLPPKIFPNKLAPQVPNNILRNPPYFLYVHFEFFH